MPRQGLRRRSRLAPLRYPSQNFMSAFIPPASLLRNEIDARHYTHATLACVCVLYAALGLSLAKMLPPWMLLAIVPLVYLRLALGLHELMHVSPAEAVSWFHRLTMIFES